MRARYEVSFARSARKELQALDPSLLRRILARIESLADEPRPRGCQKLRGGENLWRLRVGDYRVVYGVSDRDRVVDVVAVRHRREAFK